MSETDRERWNRKFRERGRATHQPSSFILSLDPLLPQSGRALDVGGGSGRHAIWLAQRGLDVTLADISNVGLELAREDAETAGVSLSLRAIDLEIEPLPEGPWDVIVDFHFLWRPLFPHFFRELAIGGMLAICHQTRRNLERHATPRLEYLLEDGELPGLLGELRIVSYDERWHDEGRHEARLLAIKPERRRGRRGSPATHAAQRTPHSPDVSGDRPLS